MSAIKTSGWEAVGLITYVPGFESMRGARILCPDHEVLLCLSEVGGYVVNGRNL
jgi:hypothetical protein